MQYPMQPQYNQMQQYPSPLMNPYMPNMNTMSRMYPQQDQSPMQPIPTQMQQIPQQASVVPGRIVKSNKDILPNETPSDGTCAFFPSEDGSCIYVHHLNDKGTIEKDVYIREDKVEAEQNQADAPGFDEILNKLDAIENLLSTKPAPKKTTSRTTKETSNA